MKEEKTKVEKVLSANNKITTIIGIFLLLFLFVGMPVGIQLWQDPDYDFFPVFVAIGAFVTILLTFVVPIWVIHFVTQFIQKKAHFKYRVNFFKLFLTIVIVAICILATYVLCTIPEPTSSDFEHWAFCLTFIPAIISVASGIVTKTEENNDKK